MRKLFLSIVVFVLAVGSLSAYAFTYQLRVRNKSGHTWVPYKADDGVVSPVWQDKSGGLHVLNPVDLRIPAGYSRAYEKKDSGTISFVAYEQGHGNKIDNNVCELVLDSGSVDFIYMHHCKLVTVRGEKGIVYTLTLTR